MLQIVNENDKYNENLERAYSSFTLQLIDCLRYKCNSFKIKRRIASEHYIILKVVKGALLIDGLGQVNRGSLVFLPKFSNVLVETDENTDFIQIVFSLSHIKSALPQKPVNLLVETDILKNIERLYRVVNFQNTIDGVNEAILLDIINELSKYFSATSCDVELYQKICQWIEENSERDISAQDVAKSLGYSREHLNRIIKSIDNESLSDKIVKYRIENIKALCEAEHLSASEIAEKLGFYSRELLCKYFKYHTGISINEYRKTLRSI